MKKKVICLILIQLSIIFLLAYKIYQNKKKVLGSISVNPIKTDEIKFNTEAQLKHLYEPEPNSKFSGFDWSPYKITNTINSDSLNDRFNYSINKPVQTYRIITLGDSFTYGLNVNTDENWTELLEDNLNSKLQCKSIAKFEVINLGMHGYDIQYAVERYKIRGKKYNPDLVLWFIRDGNLTQNDEILISKEITIREEMKRSGEFDRLVKQKDLYPSWHRAYLETYQELGEENLVNMQKDFLRRFDLEYQGPLLMFTFSFTKEGYKKVLKDYIISRKNAHFFDGITNIYSNSDYYFLTDSHPTKKGHQIISEDLFKYLSDNKIIPCQ